MSWTARFALGLLAALGLMAIETDWFGLMPGSSTNLLADACVLSLTALYAARVSLFGAGAAMFAALWILYLDEATIGLGVPPQPFVPPLDFWITTVLRAAAAWAGFALVAGGIGRHLPPRAVALGTAAGLLGLPFLRYNEWGLVVAALADPSIRTAVVLTVPWSPLVATATAITAAITLVPRRLRTVALVGAGALAVASPLGAYAADEVQLSGGLEVSPNAGGPLELVTVRARFDARNRAVEAFWDGTRAQAGPALPTAPVRLHGVVVFTFYPGAQPGLTPGTHDVGLASALDARHATFFVMPPSGTLQIEADATGKVSIHGPRAAPVRVLIRDMQGISQVLERSLDPAGEWRADVPLPAGMFVLIAQSGETWTSAEVHVP